jgi:hypothetical protein
MFEGDDDDGAGLPDSGANEETSAVETPVEDHQEEDNDEDSPESYGKRVNKRINKLVYERNLEREERERIANELAETRAQVEELRKRHEEDTSRKSEQEYTNKRAELLARKREALDMGNSDEVIRIDEELFDMVASARGKPDNKSEPKPEPRQQQQPQPSVPQAGADWAERNAWINDPAQKARYANANAIYLDLINNQGYDPEDQETYEVLDRKLKRQPQPQPSGGGLDRGNLSGKSSNLTITAQDKEKMRGWGLDPDDPATRKEWLDNKRKARG